MGGNLENLTVRLPKAMVDRLDELAAAMSKHPDFNIDGTVTRAQVIRQAITLGVKALEKQMG